MCCHPATVTPSADTIADDKRSASSSPGSHATQASMPRGAASLARIACASAVVLPNPAPATTAVTGTSNRAASASSRRARTSSSGSGDGGNGARRPPGACGRLTGRHLLRTCGFRAFRVTAGLCRLSMLAPMGDERMKLYLANAIGRGSTELAAFDAALVGAGVANFNLIRLSSVIPPNGEIVEVERCPFAQDGGWGDRLYAVYAEQRTSIAR